MVVALCLPRGGLPLTKGVIFKINTFVVILDTYRSGRRKHDRLHGRLNGMIRDILIDYNNFEIDY
jgi:hypothetical protein